jgi:hypothetical protein
MERIDSHAAEPDVNSSASRIMSTIAISARRCISPKVLWTAGKESLWVTRLRP